MRIGFRARTGEIFVVRGAGDTSLFRLSTARAPLNLTTERCDQAPLAESAERMSMSEDFDAVARHCRAMAQRVGTQIAELPVEVREVAFAGAEICLREAGSEFGVAGHQLDTFVDLQMRAIRLIVSDFDVSGARRRESA